MIGWLFILCFFFSILSHSDLASFLTPSSRELTLLAPSPSNLAFALENPNTPSSTAFGELFTVLNDGKNVAAFRETLNGEGPHDIHNGVHSVTHPFPFSGNALRDGNVGRVLDRYATLPTAFLLPPPPPSQQPFRPASYSSNASSSSPSSSVVAAAASPDAPTSAAAAFHLRPPLESFID